MGKNRIVVFGASGYIGKFLCDYLRKNNFEVIRSSSVDCDLLNPASVKNFFVSLPERSYSAIFLATTNQLEANSIVGFKKNIRILLNLIEEIDLDKVSSLIYFSSVKVYGNQPKLPISEKTVTNPIDWYSLAKVNCEWMLNYCLGKKLPVTILRIPGIYGEAARERSIIGNFIKDIHQNGKVTVFGSGKVKRDYVYIGDLARIVEQLIVRYSNGGVGILNIATGQAHSILKILDKIRGTLGMDFVIGDSMKGKNNFDLRFNTRKLIKLLPSFNFTKLEDGICSYKK